MQGDKERQEISVMGRLLSLEALVFLMGMVSLVYGLFTGSLRNILVGGVIVIAAAVFIWRSRR